MPTPTSPTLPVDDQLVRDLAAAIATADRLAEQAEALSVRLAETLERLMSQLEPAGRLQLVRELFLAPTAPERASP